MDGEQVRQRWRGVAAWLDASPTELAGLVVLAVGALATIGVLWWTSQPVPVAAGPAPSPSVAESDGAAVGLVGQDRVTLHVAGAVGIQGLVSVPVGSRVADALAAAGGLTLDADPSALNLAREVVDGERIDVPRMGQAPPPDATSAAGPDSPSAGGDGVRPDGAIDLNRATATELEALPGVGPVLASRIVHHRERHGPFTEISQLRDVSGIGEKTFQTLVDLVTL